MKQITVKCVKLTLSTKSQTKSTSLKSALYNGNIFSMYLDLINQHFELFCHHLFHLTNAETIFSTCNYLLQ